MARGPSHRPAPARLRQGIRALLIGIFATAVLGLSAFIGFWAATGGRWFIVETPSMGTAAPVGTLLWVKPAPFDELRVGQIISFRPPHSTNVYSHRIVAITPQHDLVTRGDINTAPDPWRLTASDVIGRVVTRWWGVGWVIEAAPIFLIGGAALVVLVARFTAPRWKVPAATVGVAVLLSVAVFVTRPLTRGDFIRFVRTAGGARATYVSSGILPVRLSAGNGSGHIDLNDGQVGTVLVTHLDRRGHYVAHVEPRITWWIWLTAIGACFAPALSTLAVRHPPTGVRPEDDRLAREGPSCWHP